MRTVKEPVYERILKLNRSLLLIYTSRSRSVSYGLNSKPLILNPPCKACKACFSCIIMLQNSFMHKFHFTAPCLTWITIQHCTVTMLLYYHFLFRPQLPSMIQPVKLKLWIIILPLKPSFRDIEFTRLVKFILKKKLQVIIGSKPATADWGLMPLVQTGLLQLDWERVWKSW